MTLDTDRPPLRRSGQEKMLAGVCGGFGRYTGVDPVLFRVALVVLTFFGGVGGIIYLAGWLFLPEDGDEVSPAEALVGRGRSHTSTSTTVVLLVVGAIGISTALDGRHAALLALALAGGYYLARHHGRPSVGSPAGPDLLSPADPTVPLPTAPLPTAPLPTAFAPHGPYVDPYGGATAPAYQPPPPDPVVRPPKQRSRLGRFTLSAALLAVGVIAVLDQLGFLGIGPAPYLAVALGVVAAGLLVGTWYGRSRGLIVLGLLLSLALAAVTAVGHVAGSGKGIGTRLWEPRTVAELDPAYDLGVGDATLDLRNVTFADRSLATKVHVGIGQLVVRVPADVDVTVTAQAGAGNLKLFDQRSNGTGLHRTVTDLGADGAGGGTLQLRIDDGIGDVEVTRD